MSCNLWRRRKVHSAGEVRAHPQLRGDCEMIVDLEQDGVDGGQARHRYGIAHFKMEVQAGRYEQIS
jgi:hypothetical protein